MTTAGLLYGAHCQKLQRPAESSSNAGVRDAHAQDDASVSKLVFLAQWCVLVVVNVHKDIE